MLNRFPNSEVGMVALGAYVVGGDGCLYGASWLVDMFAIGKSAVGK